MSDKDMGYEWEELCDSQDFNHGDRFVELDDYLLIKSKDVLQNMPKRTQFRKLLPWIKIHLAIKLPFP